MLLCHNKIRLYSNAYMYLVLNGFVKEGQMSLSE